MSSLAGNQVRVQREARGMSQHALAERAQLSRQSVGAIEAGRATPAVDVALRLARVLDSRVEDLFGPPQARGTMGAELVGQARSARVALVRIADRWLAYPLVEDAVCQAADGLVVGGGGGRVDVEPLRADPELRDGLLLTGCAAGLGLLADRLNSRPGPGRFRWLARSSTAALHALARQRTHVAGVHLVDKRTGEPSVAEVRRLEHDEPIVVIAMARWQVGLVARAGDARPVLRPADLGRPGLRIVGREAGAGAQRQLERALRTQGLPLALARRPRLTVGGHLDVARAVAMGAGDTGVATRDAALAFALAFVPLAEERYDLALPRSSLADPRVARMLDVLVSAPFRRELAALGYDVGPAGERVAEVACA